MFKQTIHEIGICDYWCGH